LAIIGLANPKEVGNDKLRPLCDLVRHAIAVPARYVNLAAISAPVDAGGVGRGLLLREHEVRPRQQARQAPAVSRDLEAGFACAPPNGMGSCGSRSVEAGEGL
jgi:hypothetical protein